MQPTPEATPTLSEAPPTSEEAREFADEGSAGGSDEGLEHSLSGPDGDSSAVDSGDDGSSVVGSDDAQNETDSSGELPGTAESGHTASDGSERQVGEREMESESQLEEEEEERESRDDYDTEPVETEDKGSEVSRGLEEGVLTGEDGTLNETATIMAGGNRTRNNGTSLNTASSEGDSGEDGEGVKREIGDSQEHLSDNGNGAVVLSGQQQKEKSVFLRLSNRIRDLEENMSLFSSYLDQISTG